MYPSKVPAPSLREERGLGQVPSLSGNQRGEASSQHGAGGPMGPRCLKPWMAPEYGRELATAIPAEVETSPHTAGLPAPRSPWHRGVQMLLPLPPQSPAAPTPIRDSSVRLHQQPEGPKTGGQGDGTPCSCSSFLQLLPEAMEKEQCLKNRVVPRTPCRQPPCSPASGITSPAGEDRAGSPPSLEHRHLAGAWPQGAVARRPPQTHAQCLAKVRPRCQASNPARGRARCGPTQPCVASPGTVGTRKSCWKRTSLSRLGQRAPAPASPALHPNREGSEAWWRESGWELGCSAPLTGVLRGKSGARMLGFPSWLCGNLWGQSKAMSFLLL